MRENKYAIFAVGRGPARKSEQIFLSIAAIVFLLHVINRSPDATSHLTKAQFPRGRDGNKIVEKLDKSFHWDDLKWSRFLDFNLTHCLRISNLLSTHDNCYAKMIWTGSSFFRSFDEFHIICKNNKAAMNARLDLYELFLTRALSRSKLGRFAFIMNFADATRHAPRLYSLLDWVPFASFGKSSEDKVSFLLPDPHMVLGLAWLDHVTDVIPPSMVGFAMHVSKYYNVSYQDKPRKWQSRVSTLRYRGGCHPTIDPESIGGHMLTRGEFCLSLYNEHHVDYRLVSSGTQHCSSSSDRMQYMESCSPCCSNASLPLYENSTAYKYQLILDGYGPSYDGSIWKFLSCSTILKGEHSSGTRLVQFYEDFLTRGDDYLVVNATNVTQTISICEGDDTVDCARVGSNGCSKVSEMMSLNFLLNYTNGMLLEISTGRHPIGSNLSRPLHVYI
ncbi:hypothetical protein M9434_002524 [Picochlorum sp. BPE23]|nr:hypothetical protein M9434_002524 [Picochlorum sp. BPE23]